MKKLFLLAGEASGDVLGARLIKEIKARYPNVELRGVGGHLMEEEGLDIVVPSDSLSVMGIWEIIGNFARLKKIHGNLVEDIEAFDPDAVITIDFPDFNFLLGRALKKRGKTKAKLVHYVAPSVWAWRPGRAKAVAGFLDGIMCLFPFEPKYFEAHGLHSKFVGHPLVADKPDHGDGAAFRARHDIPEDAKVIGLFLGSRQAELKMMSRTLKDVVFMVRDSHPDVHVVVPTLPHLEFEVLKLMEGVDVPVYVVPSSKHKWDAFAACDAALAVSGTVGLELSYCGIPHVIAYKASIPTWLIIKMLVRVKYAHLVNILLEGDYVPEFLQFQCDSMKIGHAVLDLLEEDTSKSLARQKEASLKIRGLIGAYDKKLPSQKAVDFIEAVVEERVEAMPVSKAKTRVEVGAGDKISMQETSKPAVKKVEKDGDKEEPPYLAVLKKLWAFLRAL